MTEETRDEKFSRQTCEQFEWIGRFVQSFELMVDAARGSALLLLRPVPQRMLNIVLHHSSMTAWPLFEIVQALYGEMIAQDTFPKEQADVVRGVLKQVAADYSDLLSQRNIVSHRPRASRGGFQTS